MDKTHREIADGYQKHSECAWLIVVANKLFVELLSTTNQLPVPPIAVRLSS